MRPSGSSEVVAFLSFIGLSLAGCAGAPPSPPSEPVASSKAAKPDALAAKAPTPTAAPEPAPEAHAPPSPPADEPRDGLRKASRPPMALLTGNHVVYVLNFAGSASGEAAKAQCESVGDTAAIRQCLSKERERCRWSPCAS